MSFEKDGITYKEILDSAPLGFTTISHFWVVKSNGVVGPLPATLVAERTHSHAIIYNGSERFECTGSFNLIKSESPAQSLIIKTGGASVYTSPSLNGTLIYADGFVQHSTARLKQNIVDLPPSVIDKAKTLRPRSFLLNGNKPGIGFIVEEVPVELRQQTQNAETHNMEEGVDIMALCAFQQKLILDLEQRIIVLEGKIK